MTQPNADQVSTEQTRRDEELLHVFYAGLKNGIYSGLVYAGAKKDRAQVFAEASTGQAYNDPIHRDDALLIIRRAVDCVHEQAHEAGEAAGGLT